MAKKPKIKFQESVFDNIPEAKREKAKKEILEELGKMSMEELKENSVAIESLPEGAQVCPLCGAALKAGPAFPIPPDGKVIQIFDCTGCGAVFEGKPLN